MDYKVEGNIIYPDKTMLTWGPFYYHQEEPAKNRMKAILHDIVNWCNLKDPTLNIVPQNLIKTRCLTQRCFTILAWKDEETLQECDGIIEVESIYFED